jgi:hypothetical protein
LVARGDQQKSRGVGPDPKECEQHWGLDLHEGNDEFVETLELLV